MVLATEMTKHFEHLNRFVSVVDQDPEVCFNTSVNMLKTPCIFNMLGLFFKILALIIPPVILVKLMATVGL